MKKSINLFKTGTSRSFGLILLLGMSVVSLSCAKVSPEAQAAKEPPEFQEPTESPEAQAVKESPEFQEPTESPEAQAAKESSEEKIFSCGKFQEYTATNILLSNNEEVPLTVWQDSGGQTAEQRCAENTEKLQEAYSKNEHILSINQSNNAVCSTKEIGGSCENDLFILDSDAENALNVIFAIEEEPTNEARMLLQGERYARAQSQEDGWSGSRPYFDLKELRNQWLRLREQKQKP